MSVRNEFQEFLKQYFKDPKICDTETDGASYSILEGGKINVPISRQAEFLAIYAEFYEKKGLRLGLSEYASSIFMLFFDLDYPEDTDEFPLLLVIDIIQRVLKKSFIINPGKCFKTLVATRPDGKKKYHIYFPEIFVNSITAISLREFIINEFLNVFSNSKSEDLYMFGSIVDQMPDEQKKILEKIFDRAVFGKARPKRITQHAHLRMCFCPKYNEDTKTYQEDSHYELTYLIPSKDYNPEDFEIQLKKIDKTIFDSDPDVGKQDQALADLFKFDLILIDTLPILEQLKQTSLILNRHGSETQISMALHNATFELGSKESYNEGRSEQQCIPYNAEIMDSFLEGKNHGPVKQKLIKFIEILRSIEACHEYIEWFRIIASLKNEERTKDEYKDLALHFSQGRETIEGKKWDAEHQTRFEDTWKRLKQANHPSRTHIEFLVSRFAPSEYNEILGLEPVSPTMKINFKNINLDELWTVKSRGDMFWVNAFGKIFSNPPRVIVISVNKSNSIFYYWNGTIWSKDADHSLLNATAQSAFWELLKALQNHFEKREKPKGENSEYDKILGEIKTLFGEIKKLPRLETYVKGASFHFKKISSEFLDKENAIKGFFPAANGLINLRTGEIRPILPNDFITEVGPCEYKGLDYDTREVEEAMLEICDGLTEKVIFLQKLFGYGLTAENVVKMFALIYGPKYNAKSTIIRFLVAAAGKYYVCGISNDVIIKRKPASSGSASPHLYALRGGRIYHASETDEGDEISEATAKNLSSAGDAITCRDLYGPQVTFVPHGITIVVTNYRLKMKASADAMWERTAFVELDVQFLPEPNPANPKHRKMDSDKVQRIIDNPSAILTWLVKGAMRYYAEGLIKPDCVKASTFEYRRTQSVFEMFISVCYERTKNHTDFIPFDDFEKKYKTYQLDYSQPKINRTDLLASCKESFDVKERWETDGSGKKTKKYDVYGLKLKDDAN